MGGAVIAMQDTDFLLEMTSDELLRIKSYASDPACSDYTAKDYEEALRVYVKQQTTEVREKCT